MSHFSVLCIGEDWKKQLEKYWELDLSIDELSNDERAIFDVKFEKENIEKEFESWKKENPEDFDKFKYKDAKEWVERWYGCYLDKYEKYYGNYFNPNAKWDWYQVGGRFSGFFRLKDGKKGNFGEKSWTNKEKEISPEYCDQALKGDIDFDFMIKENIERAKKNWDESKTDKDCIKNPTLLFFKYGIRKDDTFESYLERESSISTFAVLKDGVWYGRGRMGWWGVVSDEKDDNVWNNEFNKLIEELSDDTLLTIVDCHI